MPMYRAEAGINSLQQSETIYLCLQMYGVQNREIAELLYGVANGGQPRRSRDVSWLHRCDHKCTLNQPNELSCLCAIVG
jgi:hypothetical protein